MAPISACRLFAEITMKLLLASILLLVWISPASAQPQADHEQLRAGMWERILARLEALPDRWNRLPVPAVPVSGRSVKDVFDTATEAEGRAAYALISRLVQTAPAARAQILVQERQQRNLSELDLWFPLFLASTEQVRDLDAAGLTVEAWLDLAEQLGRRDVLLGAAWAALNLAKFRLPPARLAGVAEKWLSLPSGPNDTLGAALVHEVYGEILFKLDRNQEACDAYRKARRLYQAAHFHRGEGSTWFGEAEVLAHLGQREEALKAYRQARALFVAAGDKGGQGSTWRGEADILVRSGARESALKAYQRARTLLVDVDDKIGQGYTWMGEADIRTLQGRHEDALMACRQARTLFAAMKDEHGQGCAWECEAFVLLRLGQAENALAAYRQARDLFVAVDDKQGQGNTWDGEADALSDLGQPESALAAYRQARILFVATESKSSEGHAWVGEANVLFSQGQIEAALAAHRQARVRFSTVRDKQGQGSTWLGEARVLFRQGKNNEARAAYSQARKLFLAVQDMDGQGRTWDGEADVLLRVGQPDEALKAYRQARKLFLAVGNKKGQGYTWQGEAAVFFRLVQMDEALAAYRQAKALFVAVGDKEGEGSAWRGEADVLVGLGRNADALNAYWQAQKLCAAVGDQMGEGNAWRGVADVLFRLDQTEEALEAYLKARELVTAVSDKLGQGNAWKGIGKVLMKLRQPMLALIAVRHARTMSTAIDDKQGQGNTWQDEANILFIVGQREAALEAHRRARAMFVAIGDKLGEEGTWRDEAEVLFRLELLGPALSAAATAARLSKGMRIVPNEMIARSLGARILLARGHELEAVRWADDALALLRRWRQNGVADLDRTMMSDWTEPYEVLVPLLVRHRVPAVERALMLAEEAHAPVFLDLLAAGNRRPDNIEDASLIEERKRLQHRLGEIDRALAGTIAPGERQKFRYEREAVDALLEINGLMLLVASGSIFVNGAPIDIRARATLVEQTGPILLYYVAEEETVAFLLQPGQRAPIVRRINLSRHQLQSEVRALRHALSNPPLETGGASRQRTFFDQLVAPFSDALAETRGLTIIPHGPLHELPFEALLVDDKTALFERWHVSIAPSLSALHAVRERRTKRKPAPNDIVFVGIGGGTGLTLSGPTVEEVGAGFGAAVQIVQPGPGSHPAYLQHAPRARHLLVATHGTHVAQSRSGHLELTAAEGHPTPLTASEIAQNPLRAELVTLAACETARGEAMSSDERLDLTRAFLIAGADAVLATRWKVPATEETRLFLIDFYQALRQGGPGGTPMRKDEALTEARRRSRQRSDDAQLWAAWVLVGDAR
jgi:tetratricopeptide (TPR) repeat protein/CHAT domain-containing protein